MEKKKISVSKKSKKQEITKEKVNSKKVKEKSNEVKAKKKNILKRISKYFKGVLKELKRIRWTNLKDLYKYSLATVVFVVVLGSYFYLINWLVLLIRSLAK